MPCSRLRNILDACSSGKSLPLGGEEFLKSRGLLALVAFAKGDIDDEAFRVSARTEQQFRLIEAEKKRLLDAKQLAEETAEMEARQQTMWANRAAAALREERDPKKIAKRRNHELRERFGIARFVEQDAYQRLMTILKLLENAQRLPEADAAWLASDGRDYRTSEIMHSYHRLEANYCLQEFKDTGNVWSAVTASGHLRKCNASAEAHDLLSAIPEHRVKQAKLKCAVYTTHGGALRDLNRHGEAKRFAEEAHALLQGDYRPCTLLGAIHIELGEIAQGHEWYRKAEARGAPTEHVDGELRVILRRLPEAKRMAIIGELIATDASRYGWMRKAFGM